VDGHSAAFLQHNNLHRLEAQACTQPCRIVFKTGKMCHAGCGGHAAWQQPEWRLFAPAAAAAICCGRHGGRFAFHICAPLPAMIIMRQGVDVSSIVFKVCAAAGVHWQLLYMDEILFSCAFLFRQV
jgi:hypothetical protein